MLLKTPDPAEHSQCFLKCKNEPCRLCELLLPAMKYLYRYQTITTFCIIGDMYVLECIRASVQETQIAFFLAQL